ncbi:MAG: hypothetical protein KGJ23_03280 [Euryarchaeota archaeon]|nr:hypothetical protein [Euryarchaeota archaeon]MDE1835621.1 hypothetical protein [Euryarchaeota archaeon]MDE1878969.1 hypothetical protein [Euryarchaeota archaeon]MDE2043757.1 hypothetical protein [Thermoplasmata archaeon]
MRAVIVDTSALIFLGRLHRLRLAQVLGSVVVPGPVMEELVRGRGKDPDTVGRVEDWIRRERLEVRAVRLPPGFHPSLGVGERAVLRAASEEKDPVLLVDEGPARRVAKHLGYRVLSTPYVLLEGVRVRAITPLEGQMDLDRLVALGYFLDARLFAELKTILGEL